MFTSVHEQDLRTQFHRDGYVALPQFFVGHEMDDLIGPVLPKNLQYFNKPPEVGQPTNDLHAAHFRSDT